MCLLTYLEFLSEKSNGRRACQFVCNLYHFTTFKPCFALFSISSLIFKKVTLTFTLLCFVYGTKHPAKLSEWCMLENNQSHPKNAKTLNPCINTTKGATSRGFISGGSGGSELTGIFTIWCSVTSKPLKTSLLLLLLDMPPKLPPGKNTNSMYE